MYVDTHAGTCTIRFALLRSSSWSMNERSSKMTFKTEVAATIRVYDGEKTITKGSKNIVLKNASCELHLPRNTDTPIDVAIIIVKSHIFSRIDVNKNIIYTYIYIHTYNIC